MWGATVLKYTTLPTVYYAQQFIISICLKKTANFIINLTQKNYLEKFTFYNNYLKVNGALVHIKIP